MNLEEVLLDEELSGFLGYAPFDKQAELMGVINALPATQKRAAISHLMKPKAAAAVGTSATPRDEAMKRLGALPAEIRKALAEKRLQLADSIYYVVKAAGGQTEIRMFTNDQTKVPGISNISKQQLEKDNFFLCTGLILLAGVDADPKLAAFDTIPKQVANGDFEFKNGGHYLLPKDTSCQLFDTAQRTDIDNGLLRLHNPKWIEPQADIDFNVRFSGALAVNTNLKLLLVGASVIPY